jgi:hypothetical protein
VERLQYWEASHHVGDRSGNDSHSR